MNPCSGCSRMVVPCVLVITEPHSGIAVSAHCRFPLAVRMAVTLSIVTCATAVFPLTPHMPVVFFKPRTREREL